MSKGRARDPFYFIVDSCKSYYFIGNIKNISAGTTIAKTCSTEEGSNRLDEESCDGVYIRWFNLILDLKFISLCFKLFIIHDIQSKITLYTRIKLNH